MELECPVCNHREDYGEVGESATCVRCGAVIDPLASTLDGRTIPDLARSGALRSSPRGTTLVGASSRSTASDETAGPTSAPPRTGEFVSRAMVSAALAALDEHLEKGWLTLVESEDYVTLLSRLARARRLRGHVAITEAAQLVERLASRRADECEQEMQRAIEAGDLEAAQLTLTRLQSMTEQASRLDRAAARVSEACWQRSMQADADGMLDEARALASPPQPPSNLKRALKLFDVLLDRIGQKQYPHLQNRFELIREERTQVAEQLQQAQTHQSNLETAVAMGKVDDLIELEAMYRKDLEVGRLDRQHVEAQLDLLATRIRQEVDRTLEGHLEEVDEYMANARNAEVALARLDENRDRWPYLSPPLRRRVEQRAEGLRELVERRRVVMDRCAEARALIEQGNHAEALVRLQLETTLHADLQIDVGQEIEVAVGILTRRIDRSLQRVDEDLEDDLLDIGEIDTLLARTRAHVEELEPAAGVVEALDALSERASDAVARMRRLKRSIVRTDEQLADIRALVEQGRRQQAETLLADFADNVPPQRKYEVTRLKTKLDVAIAADEVVSQLRRLAVRDRDDAIEWALSHDQVPECRAFLAHVRFDTVFAEVQSLEQDGRYRAALARAAEMLPDAPEQVRGLVEREIERLTRIEADADRVTDILERARRAESKGQIGEAWTLFDEGLAIGRGVRAEWHRLRASAVEASSEALRRQFDDATFATKERLRLWGAESGFDDAPLYTGYAAGAGARRAEARPHLDEALEHIETLRPVLRLLAERDDASTPPDLTHRADAFRLEATLGRVEDCLDRALFDAAEALLTEHSSDPRLARAQARIRRLAFSHGFTRALQGFDAPTAERLIAEYASPDGPEALTGAEILRGCRSALILAAPERQGAATQPSPPPPTDAAFTPSTRTTASDPSTMSALDDHRDALRALDRLVKRMPAANPLVAPLRRHLEAELGRLVELTFEGFGREELPGAVFLEYELMHRLLVIDELRPRTLLDLQKVVAARLQAGADELFDWIEQHVPVSRLLPEEVRALQHRLTLLRQAMFGAREPDERFDAATERLKSAWAQANEQEDARKRRDALLRRANDGLDLNLLRDAARIEQNGLVGDQRASAMVPLWERAEASVSAIYEALSVRSFDEVEEGLAELERLGAPHGTRIVFPDPFQPDRQLEPGTAGVRAVLNDLRAAERRRLKQRDDAIEESRGRIAALWDTVRDVASRCPIGQGPHALELYVGQAAPALLEAVERLRAELSALLAETTGTDQTANTVDALMSRLPPAETVAIQRLVRDYCRQFIEDFSALVAWTQSMDLTLVEQRDSIETIVRRWRNVASVQRMGRSLSRAWSH